ncbi:copia protein [Tanacetum coccineum]|uniref:Copia protein n=1 Tax=Tanacetum coccineum TaxID=301880 RepID=A0ABQ5FU23_9ASTR
MDNPNITMEEYIRLQEEKAQRVGRTFNWQTATYGKVKYYEDEEDCFTNFESEFSAIVFDDTSDAALSCEPTASPLNDNKIDFRISFDESDDEDYTVIYDENSFSYKIISVNDLKTDSENDIDKVNMPLFSTPEPEEQNILYFNDLFPFKVIYPDDLKSDKDNDIDEIDNEQSSGDMSVVPLPNVINTDDGAYALRIMGITKEQQQALDDALVPREQRLRIGNCNYILSTTFKPKEPTFQVALDILSLIPFYQDFLISTSVPAIYMHEFWATVSYHKHCIKFRLNKKNHSFDLETFRDIYPGDIKSLSDVKVDTLYQPWRTFGTIINKCLSGKATGLDQLCLSQAQIIWGIRNKVDWHMAKDDPILTTMRFIPKHEIVQKYGAILPDTLTNQAMKDSDAYKTYHDFATGKVIPKPKYVKRSTREKTDQAPTTSLEIALSEAEQMKIVTKRSKTQFHNSHASGSGANEGTGVSLGVPDVPTYGSEDEQISWKSSDEDDDDEVSLSKDDDKNADNEDDDGQDDDNEQTESDNDSDDFVYPKFSTHDEEERQDDEDKEEEGLNLRVQTPSHYESTDDETYDEVTQGDNVEEEKLDEEQTNKEEEVNEMYNDVNINLEGRDTEMMDALLDNVQTTQVIEDTHVIITAVTPEVQQQSSSVSSGFISNMLNPNPDTDRIKALEDDFLKFKQTSLFTEAVSSIPDIVDKYLANQMNEAVKVAVQLQSDRLRTEVLIRSSNEAKASHAVAANLSELELKKILIDKMKKNKSIDISVQQKTLYKALVDGYESDKDILATYRDTVTLKRRQNDKDEDEEPSAVSNRGSKRRRAGKEPESTSAPNEKTSKSTGKSKKGSKSHQKSTDKSTQAEEPIHTDEDLEEPAH